MVIRMFSKRFLKIVTQYNGHFKIIPIFIRVIRDRIQALIYFFYLPESMSYTRYSYQKNFIKHHFTDGEKVLDIGSGDNPFPLATVLADKYINPTCHRNTAFKSEGKPVYECDICNMPFSDKEFDYVVASHILEHVDNPIVACKELQRVAKSGYIESPALMKDILFSWAKGMHKWHVIAQGNTLFFFEYTERQLEGINTQAWERLIFSTIYHPLQKAFNDNQDLFNTIFEWEDWFDVVVVNKYGEIIK
jgi:hypothetical protein